MTITADLSGYPLAAETRTLPRRRSPSDTSSTASWCRRRRAPRCRSSSPPRAPRSARRRRRRRGRRARRGQRRAGRSRTAAGATSPRSRRSVGCAASPSCSPSNGAIFSDLDVLDAGLLKAYTGAHRAVRRRRTRLLRRLADEDHRHASRPPAPTTSPCYVHPRAARRGRHHRARGTARRSSSTSSPPRWRAATRSCSSRPSRRRCRPRSWASCARRRASRPASSTSSTAPARSIGAGLVDHPDVDAIGFTGSVETGRRIQAAAAARVKRVALELGGKSAHIIFDDADLEPAAATAAAAVWGASGQVCTAGTRVLVQRGIHDEFLEQRQGEHRSAIRIGSPFDAGRRPRPGRVGQEQLERVTALRRHRRRRGSRAGPRWQAPRRPGLLLRADDLRRGRPTRCASPRRRSSAR